MRNDIRLPKITNPGQLIAAIPAVLGFTPENSLVLVTREGKDLGAFMRVDLDDQVCEKLPDLVDVAAVEGADSVIAVIVDERRGRARTHRRIYDDLDRRLRERGMSVYAGHVVDRIAAGRRWHCADGCGSTGLVADPAASPMAMAAVLDGRRLYQTRAEVEAIVTPIVDERSARFGELVRQAARSARRGPLDPSARTRQEVTAAIAAAEKLGRGEEPEEAQLVLVGQSLTHIAARDILYSLAVSSRASESEDLWVLLARILPTRWRVEALVLLGHSAYCRGDGPLAGIALDAALREDVAHRMAGMLDAALRGGIRPSKIRSMGDVGYRMAAGVGVTLPDWQPRYREAG
ncbi:DUF4192 domain-containing protein [Mycolicibacterium brumae]|uniref:DUF4192 domain-containing protein n=1 Tax=Mycolicibacterium brumae TaxID=85968 RepID=A0A2G5PDU3_9MYCO|nr:DUF4192 domain-containing protein [Mycolicibacterium brumae]MCV7193499.1 DUF4192 domain-containing protein [Mycolicibacterium brumae]PIB76084.1 DUF4192 domain-containing protein [Mycolicibacterium brumae]RWA17197.1 hypothetical protein MBRU_06120 [Mycolicibacterium brumae DSM 44177]UWW09228.1 DUF4192 domain-containing protein [Mycolicibacterium brumae]